ncbi:MAG: ABC transporter permease [Phycisphaerales bacterium]
MIQTLAIFRDAYRELNSKKMFWIVLAISAIVVGAFGAVGVNEAGISVLWWDFPSPMFNSNLIPAKTFYKIMFANLGVRIWLAWIASILALVSTASMIPDFISGGSIEMTLSKPIGRFRLFLTKYLAGMLFVTLQVVIFTLGAFLVIGLRGNTWQLGLFWAVPFTVAVFSFLFSVCVLLGMVTRSTIASLLLTLLVFFGIWAVHTVESSLLTFRTRSEMRLEKGERAVAQLQEQKREFMQTPAPGTAGAPTVWPREDELQRTLAALDRVKANSRSLALWHNGFFAAMTVLPKTSETVGLLERRLISDADLKELRDLDADKDDPPFFPGEEFPVRGKLVGQRVEEISRARSAAWILGTSFAFEAVVFGAACLIFCRRDF